MKTICSIEQKQIIRGSIENLRSHTFAGSDIILHIELDDFSESIIFNNMMVYKSDCLGFTLPHLAHGNLKPLSRIYNETLSSTIYIYDSSLKNVVMHNMASNNSSSTVVHSKNKDYINYDWIETKRYIKLDNYDSSFIKSIGSDFKVRIGFGFDIFLIAKPDIVYFNSDEEFVIKSSQILLPTPFVKSIKLFSESSEGFTDSDNFGVSYINIISDSNVVIYHIVNSLADNIIDESVKRGRLNYSLGSEEIVKEYDVTIEILVPE